MNLIFEIMTNKSRLDIFELSVFRCKEQTNHFKTEEFTGNGKFQIENLKQINHVSGYTELRFGKSKDFKTNRKSLTFLSNQNSKKNNYFTIKKTLT